MVRQEMPSQGTLPAGSRQREPGKSSLLTLFRTGMRMLANHSAYYRKVSRYSINVCASDQRPCQMARVFERGSKRKLAGDLRPKIIPVDFFFVAHNDSRWFVRFHLSQYHRVNNLNSSLLLACLRKCHTQFQGVRLPWQKGVGKRPDWKQMLLLSPIVL